jgi:exportin-T
LAVDGLLRLIETSLGAIEGGWEGSRAWTETADMALKALGAWIRELIGSFMRSSKLINQAWIDLSVSLTPRTLAFYHRLIQQPSLPLRTSTAGIFRTFVSKGIKEPHEKLEELKVLDIVSLLEPLEAQTREVGDDSEALAFRAALAAIYAAYATALIELEENVSEIKCSKT